MNLISGRVLQLEHLAARFKRPPLFEPAEKFIWSDPYIATQMLPIHLDPQTEAASRKPETIDASAAWLVERLDLAPGDALLDLGCGPGLYTRRFAARGFDVTGIDLSENSLNYAREHDPATKYICANYTALSATDYANKFNAITLIFGDFCVLSDENRDKVLGFVRGALKPEGYFAFDVMATAQAHGQQGHTPPTWSIHDSAGFWKPGPHLVLVQVHDYPADDAFCEQYLVIEADGTASEYRNWFHYYSAETITAALEANGFTVDGLYGDLTGAPYDAQGKWIGVVTRPA
jgi:SAM-dependent methyltransferase